MLFAVMVLAVTKNAPTTITATVYEKAQDTTSSWIFRLEVGHPKLVDFEFFGFYFAPISYH